MELGDMASKAKGLLQGHEKQAEEALEKAREAIKAETPDNVDGMVDTVVNKAEQYIEHEKS